MSSQRFTGRPKYETMELLLDKLGKTRSNGEFLGSMSG